MRTKAPLLLPIFRSDLQARLLAHLLLTPAGGGGPTLAQLEQATGGSSASVHREVERLEQAGLLRSERIGRARIVHVDETSPLTPPLRELVLRALGPAVILRRELAGVDGIERATVFGSWALRYHGEAGEAPRDIDLLVLGRPDDRGLNAALDRASDQIGLPVNAAVFGVAEWAERDSGFAREVRSRPMVEVIPG